MSKDRSTRVPLPRDFMTYRPELYSNLVVPSYVHGYSLAIEYMKRWFVKKFDKNYFKYIHINGKHVLDEWKHFNNYNIVREKPMLAIVPTVEYDHDREMIDTYLMDNTMLLKRSDFQQSFLKDYDNKVFLYTQMRELKMEFTFKIRVDTRAEQLDLYNNMELMFRIGATQHDYLSADFHIPYCIMLNIAHDTGFEIKDNKIVDICGFLAYINSKSELPITFKMRAINQKPEFFVRARELYTHISTIDKLQLDDGERQGKLDTNFHVEMRCELKIPIPHFFVYFNQNHIAYSIDVYDKGNDSMSIHSISPIEILPQNKLGWTQVSILGYQSEVGEEYIDLSPVFGNGGELKKIIDYHKSLGLSPSSFLDVRVYRGEETHRHVDINMNWDTLKIVFENPQEISEDLDIVIYGDKYYMNKMSETINDFSERISPEE